MAVAYGREHQSLEGVTEIGVDEVMWPSGRRKFLTVVYQINEDCRRRLWIGKDRKQRTLEAFFKWFDRERARGLHAPRLRYGPRGAVDPPRGRVPGRPARMRRPAVRGRRTVTDSSASTPTAARRSGPSASAPRTASVTRARAVATRASTSSSLPASASCWRSAPPTANRRPLRPGRLPGPRRRLAQVSTHPVRPGASPLWPSTSRPASPTARPGMATAIRPTRRST